MTKLHNVSELQGLLKFVSSIYAKHTTCAWEDSEGVKHRIVLFSLGIHDSLCPEKELFVSLGDVRVPSPKTEQKERTNFLDAEILAG